MTSFASLATFARNQNRIGLALGEAICAGGTPKADGSEIERHGPRQRDCVPNRQQHQVRWRIAPDAADDR